MSPRFPAAGRRAPDPLDAARLDALALAYVGRYATTRAKLAQYLRRKLAARGWAGDDPPPVEAIVARCAGLGYVDDAAYAVGRANALGRRGFGERRVAEALRTAGVEPDQAAPARAAAREDALAAALTFARRRRIGPFAEGDEDAARRRRALGALLRAGHAPDLARRIAFARRGSVLDDD